MGNLNGTTQTAMSVRIPNSELRELRRIAKRVERPVGWLIREAISEWLDRQMGGAA